MIFRCCLDEHNYKKRPKKTGGFSARLQKAMEQAEKQRKLQKRSR